MSGNTPVPPPVPPHDRDTDDAAGGESAATAPAGWTTPPPAAPVESIPTQTAPVWEQPTQYSPAAQPHASHQPPTQAAHYQPTQAASYPPAAQGPFQPTQAASYTPAQVPYQPTRAGYGQAAPAFPATSSGAQRTAPAGGARGGGRPPGNEKKDKLGGGWIAFIVIDVILVIVTVVYAISFFQGQSSGSNDPSSPAAQVTGSAAAKVTESRTFASESRNITCELTNLGASCTIATLNSKPAAVASCDGTVGYKAVLSGDTVTKPCLPAADQPTQAAASVTIQDYGTTAKIGKYACDSERTGMTCTHTTTGKGFRISRDGIDEM